MRIDNMTETELRDELQKELLRCAIIKKRIDNAMFNLRTAKFEAISDSAKMEIDKALKTLTKAKNV